MLIECRTSDIAQEAMPFLEFCYAGDVEMQGSGSRGATPKSPQQCELLLKYYTDVTRLALRLKLARGVSRVERLAGDVGEK